MLFFTKKKTKKEIKSKFQTKKIQMDIFNRKTQFENPFCRDLIDFQVLINREMEKLVKYIFGI